MQKNQIGSWILYVGCVLALLWAPAWLAEIAGWLLGGILAAAAVPRRDRDVLILRAALIARARGSLRQPFLHKFQES